MSTKEQNFPVFGLSEQRELLYQTEVNILKQHVSEIVVVLEAIDAEILLIYNQLPNIIADLNWLNANAITDLTMVSTYNSISCPGYPVADLFGPPTVAALNPGVSTTINARPLTSLDNSVLIAHDVICGVINLQVSDVVSLASTGLESLVASAPRRTLKSKVWWQVRICH